MWVCLWQFSVLCNRKGELTQHHSQACVFVVKWGLHLFWFASFALHFVGFGQWMPGGGWSRLWQPKYWHLWTSASFHLPSKQIILVDLFSNRAFSFIFWLWWIFASEQHFSQFLFFLSSKIRMGFFNSAHVPSFTSFSFHKSESQVPS